MSTSSFTARPPHPPLLCPRCLSSGADEVEMAADTDAACAACGFSVTKTPAGAEIAVPDDSGSAPYYEGPAVVEEYLAFHFPPGHADPLAGLLGERAPAAKDRFPFCVPALARQGHEGSARARARARAALDLGCATGAVSLLLAEDHDAVTGLDRSPALIDTARGVAETGRARYSVKLEGEIRVEHEVTVAASAEVRARVRFLVGDALAVPLPSRAFATVTALNLIDRVPDPARALSEAARLVAPGGVLVVSSPYTWLEAYAKKERWLGGVRRDGQPVRGRETVIASLAPDFAHVLGVERPFYIPHHARTGQLGLSLIDVFRRVG